MPDLLLLIVNFNETKMSKSSIANKEIQTNKGHQATRIKDHLYDKRTH